MSGVLVGRAVEPHAGEGHGSGGLCLNCGTALIGDHCHNCGQAGHVHRTLHAVGHEILHGVFHFEGKLWRTLPLLVWRPGDLTRRYIAGERARFVSPMAIFLFSIFVMFAAFSFAGISTPVDLSTGSGRPLAAIKADREKLVKEQQEAIETLRSPRADAEDRADAKRDVAQIGQRIDALDAAAAQLKPQEAEADPEVHTGWYTLDHGIEKWRKNPSLMLYKLQSSAYKFSWLLIPLSLPFVWLLFAWKRQYRLYDHTVFITYSIAFMSLLLVTIVLLGAVGAPSEVRGTLGTVVPIVHITRQLKQAYSLRWWSAILRAVLLSLFIGVVLALFVALLALMGMMG